MNFANGPPAPGDELFDAARRDDVAQVKKILSKSKRVDQEDSDGRTALWWAAGMNVLPTPYGRVSPRSEGRFLPRGHWRLFPCWHCIPVWTS
jgi:hypothetical protein